MSTGIYKPILRLPNGELAILEEEGDLCRVVLNCNRNVAHIGIAHKDKLFGSCKLCGRRNKGKVIESTVEVPPSPQPISIGSSETQVGLLRAPWFEQKEQKKRMTSRNANDSR